jgi:vancomycin resistance protein VanJ
MTVMRQIFSMVKAFASILVGIYLLMMLAWLALRFIAGDAFWWLSLINSFSLYLFVPLAVTLPIALWLRSPLVVVGNLLLAAALVVLAAPMFTARQRVSAAGPTLSVTTFNMLATNPDPVPLEAWLRDYKPDVVLLQEIIPEYAQNGVRRLRDLYPYQYVHDWQWGDAMLSRFPIKTSEDILPNGQTTFVYQRVELEAHGRTLVIYNVHAPVPLRFNAPPRFRNTLGRIPLLNLMLRYDDSQRAREIAMLTDSIGRETLPTLVGGDFNLSDQAPSYAAVAAVLTDTWREAETGLGATFPAGGHLIPVPLVRLDYIWHNGQMRAVSGRVGPLIKGSDHLPVSAVIALAS